MSNIIKFQKNDEKELRDLAYLSDEIVKTAMEIEDEWVNDGADIQKLFDMDFVKVCSVRGYHPMTFGEFIKMIVLFNLNLNSHHARITVE